MKTVPPNRGGEYISIAGVDGVCGGGRWCSTGLRYSPLREDRGHRAEKGEAPPTACPEPCTLLTPCLAETTLPCTGETHSGLIHRWVLSWVVQQRDSRRERVVFLCGGTASSKLQTADRPRSESDCLGGKNLSDFRGTAVGQIARRKKTWVSRDRFILCLED